MRPAGRRQTVLIVDDDAIVRLMATEALSDTGHHAVEAPDAESGWEQFDREGADLVLLDVILPGMNGFEACARLRAHARGVNVPIIVMTGLDDRTSIASAYDSFQVAFKMSLIVTCSQVRTILGAMSMARPRRVDMELVAQAQAAAIEANDLEALRCAQAVLLPALLGATLGQR